MRRLPVFVLPLLTAGVASQGGLVEDDNVRYTITSYPSGVASAAGFANYTASSCTNDNVYQCWWMYRVQGDQQNSVFNDGNGQLTESFNGNNATLTWQDVDARGQFAANYTIVANSTGDDAGFTIHVMTISNLTQSALPFNLFGYVDIDHNQSAGIESTAPASSANRFIVTDTEACGGCTEYYGVNPTNYEVGTFAGVRNRILGSAYDLQNSGLPFGPGDFTGAMQWVFTVPPGGSITQTVFLGHNDIFAGVGASSTHYGTGVAGQFGPPVIITKRAPVVGGTSEVQVSYGPQNGTGVLLVGLARANIQAFGLTILNTAEVPLPLTLDAGGVARQSFDLPDCDPSFAGVKLMLQAFLSDPTSQASLPFTHSNGLEWTFGD